LIESLIRAGYSVYAVAPPDEYSERIVQQWNIPFVPVRRLQAKESNPFRDIQLMFEFWRIQRKYRFDAALCYTSKANIYFNLGTVFQRVVYLNTVNGLGSGMAGSQWIGQMMHRLYKMAFRRSDAVIFQNPDDRKYFLKHELVPEYKTHVVNGSGIDLSLFPPKTRFEENCLCLRFLWTSRLVKEKGIIEFIEAAARIKKTYPNCQFIVCGLPANNPSAISPQLVETAAKKETITYIAGTDDMNAMLDECDVLVFPSYYREGVPRILLEGLSKGLPLITTTSVGCRETILNEVNGYTVDIRNGYALAEVMEKMILLPPAKRREMEKQSRKLAEEKFDVHKVNAKYLELLQKLT